jgi:hypothetical protein
MVELVLTCGVIYCIVYYIILLYYYLLYIYYYYIYILYIIHIHYYILYLILYSSSIFSLLPYSSLSFPILLFLYTLLISSSSSSFSPLLPIPPSHSFILYLSVLTYTYLYSILPHSFSNKLSINIKRNTSSI